MEQNDVIIIRELRVRTHIGVPDEERATPQELLVNVELSPEIVGQSVADDISRTVDYHAVVLRLEALAAERPRKLIETLAEEMAAVVLDEFAVVRVVIEIEKFILPQTRCVGVRITRSK